MHCLLIVLPHASQRRTSQKRKRPFYQPVFCILFFPFFQAFPLLLLAQCVVLLHSVVRSIFFLTALFTFTSMTLVIACQMSKVMCHLEVYLGYRLAFQYLLSYT